jgi:erythromycin esterase
MTALRGWHLDRAVSAACLGAALSACAGGSGASGAPPAPASRVEMAAPRVEASARSPAPLARGAAQQHTLEPSAAHRYTLAVAAGESCDVVVTQDGVDVVLELFSPEGERLASVDSPNGRKGDEPLEIVAGAAGSYEILVRPIDQRGPPGRYRIAVTAWRDAQATAIWLAQRAAVRAEAIAWLRARAGRVRLGDARGAPSIEGPGLAQFDRLARRSRVLGLGEATHGSRQLADVRLALTRRLVERHGVRLIALEASSARMRLVDRWARGAAAADARADGAALEEHIGTLWINRRGFLALARFAREWNLRHRRDPVTLVGLDPQDSAPGRDALAALVARAYPPEVAGRVAALLQRMAVADTRALGFHRVDVSAEDARSLQQLVGSLEVRRPLLTARLGETPVDDAIAGARALAQFAEFNGDGPGHSRDWMMAANLLRELGRGARAVVWAHNAHVAHAVSRRGDEAPVGGLLREVLGGDYAAVATSFHQGGFVAQLPGDGERLQAFVLPPASGESIDGALAAMELGDAIVTWAKSDGAALPHWLSRPQPMYWVGGLFSSELLPHEWTRRFQLTSEFDGLVFLTEVDAEPLPGGVAPRAAP